MEVGSAAECLNGGDSAAEADSRRRWRNTAAAAYGGTRGGGAVAEGELPASPLPPPSSLPHPSSTLPPPPSRPPPPFLPLPSFLPAQTAAPSADDVGMNVEVSPVAVETPDSWETALPEADERLNLEAMETPDSWETALPAEDERLILEETRSREVVRNSVHEVLQDYVPESMIDDSYLPLTHRQSVQLTYVGSAEKGDDGWLYGSTFP